MFKLKYIVGAVLSLSINTAFSSELEPFTSDGCSSFPDGTFEQNELWLNCCIEHDFAYWKGGTYAQRELADIELKQCVEAVGEEEIAVLMLAGVRVGGSPYFPTSFRWGYGWPYPKFYGELSAEEIEAINKQLMGTRYEDRINLPLDESVDLTDRTDLEH